MLKDLNFNPQKPFFGLVYTYLCAVHGNLELISRGFTKATHNVAGYPGAIEKLSAMVNGQTTKDRLSVMAEGKVTTLLCDLALRSKANSQHIALDIDELADIAANQQSLVIEEFATQAAGSLLVLAWDTTAESHTCEPEWEFLRHCRNAAAHNGRFHFLHNEPRRLAIWRGLEVKNELEGRNLFRVNEGDPFLGPGDVLVLLSDLEKKLK